MGSSGGYPPAQQQLPGGAAAAYGMDPSQLQLPYTPAAVDNGGGGGDRGGRSSRGRGGRGGAPFASGGFSGRGSGGGGSGGGSGGPHVNLEISGYPDDLQYNEFIGFFNTNGPPGFRFYKVQQQRQQGRGHVLHHCRAELLS